MRNECYGIGACRQVAPGGVGEVDDPGTIIQVPVVSGARCGRGGIDKSTLPPAVRNPICGWL